ncbi:histidine kinase [Gordoniibacillus kamchatkensis]|uniref:histidine kinase n=1 Tax=Gordoniibacillus kamchatkensis TaxID=1590651 RepID=A0ABR5ACX5_9BACL|nr:ATP-binding protein [Paenibacillus sp. VKM B-2647]KIL38893.1 histidine kinase [Paenibacillus sp. VKM B-2647]
MPDIRTMYLNALTKYVQSAGDDSMAYTSELGPVIAGLLPEDLIALHEESMQVLIRSVSLERALQYYHKSFVFLIELIVFTRMRRQTGHEEDLLSDLRQMLIKTEHSFKQIKSKYENVLQHMDSGIALFDQEGYLSFANLKLSQIIGIPRKTLLGRDFISLLRAPGIDREQRKMFIRLYRELVEYRVPFKEMTSGNGRHFLVSAKYDEELEGDILISVKDVTEFKKIEQSAYHNDKLAMLGKIAAAIAHEIRNPLTSIRGFIQLLLPELQKLGRGEYGRIILDEIDRANEIIYEFLNSSKPSAPDKRKVRVAELLHEVTLLFQSEALLKGCQIDVDPIDDDIIISVDTKQIKQVFLNIIKNAVEVIGESQPERGGRVHIRVQRSNDSVWISFRDNGRGMDAKTLSRLFDPFFTTKSEGTGLGLSVCYRIIKNHGGTIQVDSELSVGTTFRVQLPLH